MASKIVGNNVELDAPPLIVVDWLEVLLITELESTLLFLHQQLIELDFALRSRYNSLASLPHRLHILGLAYI